MLFIGPQFSILYTSMYSPAEAATHWLYYPDWLRPELFPGIGVLPGPAAGSYILNRGAPVAPLGQPQLNFPEKKSSH